MNLSVLFFFLFILISFQQSFAINAYGIFMVVKGDVKILKGNNWSTAKVGLQVIPGDTIETGRDSRAKIVMMDRNVISISPDTKIQIQKYENNPDTQRKSAQIFLEQGKIRQTVEEVYDGDKNKFLIKTPTAVAGVRGTEFVVSHDQQTQKSEVFTLKGQVSFASLQNGQFLGKPVLIQKGETSSSHNNTPPLPPQKMPESMMQEIDQSSRTSLFNKPDKKENITNNEQTKSASNNKQTQQNDKKNKGPMDGRMKQALLAGGPEFDPNMMPPLPPPPQGPPPPNFNGLPPPNPAATQIIKDLINRTNVKIQPR